MKNFFQKNQTGDTIIEVLLSMTVLAIVAGAAYATSSLSFRAGLNTQFRDQALSYAQQQVELLKNADNSATISQFAVNNTPFCIDPASPGARQPIANGQTGCTPPGGGNSGEYKESTTYDPSAKTFTVAVKWTSADNRPQQVNIIYKASNSYVPCDAGNPCGAAAQRSNSTSPPQAGITISAAPTPPAASVAYQGTATVTWQAVNVNLGSCSASGNWSGNKTEQGTQVSGPLTANPSIFTLTCTGFDGNPFTKSAPITVAAAPTPSLSFSAGSNSFQSGGSTTLTWSATNIPSNACTASGNWSGSQPISGSAGTGGLSTGSYSYTLTCQGYTTQAQQTQNINVTPPPPPPPPPTCRPSPGHNCFSYILNLELRRIG
ncbi:MAG: exported protein of unknown function [Candidatus Saccharibacteria bacterium]|nr:exported protein of unknown function [Candidatus Saccharibacteria bacterium]